MVRRSCGSYDRRFLKPCCESLLKMGDAAAKYNMLQDLADGGCQRNGSVVCR